MLVKLHLKSPDLDFDIDYDQASFALYFCLVFKLRGSFATLHLLFQVLQHINHYSTHMAHQSSSQFPHLSE